MTEIAAKMKRKRSCYMSVCVSAAVLRRGAAHILMLNMCARPLAVPGGRPRRGAARPTRGGERCQPVPRCTTTHTHPLATQTASGSRVSH
ncbi:hypothetical protein niasHT_012153 [Heterodera trifolii]|uniref:Secreted protein n=1 Tax=Heterodera trifolii TaxID=157864 RepID=A0ABD2LAH3_9BILA